jgi:hypothetical protein
LATISATKVLYFIDICKFLGKKGAIFFPFNVFLALFTVIQYVKDHILSQSSIQKNTAYAFVHTGVWHNPRIKKQKQYIPKYALTLSIVS